MQGLIQGGHRGQMTPFESVLILKQALQMIILIGAKIIINLLYYKAQEPHKNYALAHRAFFITKRLVKLLT